MKRSYLFLAPGFEETEALATVDVMRRAGMEVLTVAINPENSEKVCGAHGVVVVADLLPEYADFTDVEWLICPGGMPGAQNLADSRIVTEALRAHAAKGGKIAAICASPALVLAPLGILDGREATCYPGMQPESDKIVMRDAPVVALDSLITGNGPASTLAFALAIVRRSCGDAVAQQIGSGMLVYPKSMNFYF
ncbi:DJ-1 family glyoxalase III [Paramuribaculum intestinale]|uniref:DJ-1 family glyoxalase III n=1 Tax=Paramuribaculum intestinale TaxID=2094151 RepID=UPI0025A95D66|nr:DJ-1 family glyoxalase III [Paramuribaculum intestinale]